MKPREIIVQESIEKKLSEFGIFPFSIICTIATDHDGLVSITFFINSDLKELLKILDYDNLCDKSGYVIINEANTIILYDLALINFYVNIL